MNEVQIASNNGATHRAATSTKTTPFSDEIKAQAVERIKQGELTWVIAQGLGAQDMQVRDWCKRAGFTPPPAVHDAAFVQAAVQRRKAGDSETAVILAFGITQKTLRTWVAGKSTPRQIAATMKEKRAAVAVLDKKKPKKPRRIIDLAFKQKAVARVRAGEEKKAVADSLDIHRTVLANWLHGKGMARGLPKGEKALIKKVVAKVMNKPHFTVTASGMRKFTEEFKQEMVARADAGESERELSIEYGLAYSQILGWRRVLAGKTSGGGLRKYQRHASPASPAPSASPAAPTGAMPMAAALAMRDAITYLKHVKTDMYALLQTGQIKEFEEYHLNVLAALKRLQSAT